jgi:hypothetical protein
MKQKASGLGIEMRTFTCKSGTKYLTFKTPRGSYHTFSEVIARGRLLPIADRIRASRIGDGQNSSRLG